MIKTMFQHAKKHPGVGCIIFPFLLSFVNISMTISTLCQTPQFKLYKYDPSELFFQSKNRRKHLLLKCEDIMLFLV